jgi:hypothetical protein
MKDRRVGAHACADLPRARRGARRGAPDAALLAPDDAVVRIDAAGVYGADLHIHHGRLKIEAGFTIGHECPPMRTAEVRRSRSPGAVESFPKATPAFANQPAQGTGGSANGDLTDRFSLAT